jgi:hypothetical protein
VSVFLGYTWIWYRIDPGGDLEQQKAEDGGFWDFVGKWVSRLPELILDWEWVSGLGLLLLELGRLVALGVSIWFVVWLLRRWEEVSRKRLERKTKANVERERAERSAASPDRTVLGLDDQTYRIEPGADLKYAQLWGRDLSWAVLTGSDLSRADLGTANLSYADLRGANLRRANLKNADLSSADLSSADLRGAELFGIKHLSACFDGALWSNSTNWQEVSAGRPHWSISGLVHMADPPD